MRLKDYIRQANADHQLELQIFADRNKDYATRDNIFDNSEKTASICAILDIDVKTPSGVEWFHLIEKIVRECKKHKEDNFFDAVNYLRRIKMLRGDSGIKDA